MKLLYLAHSNASKKWTMPIQNVTRYRKQTLASGDSQRWVAVGVAPRNSDGSELAVLLSTGRRIEVKCGFDAGTLRQLVAVLEQA